MAKTDNAFTYFLWAREKFGTQEALSRVWRFHLHPRHGVQAIKDAVREFQLVDRRTKKSWPQRVWAVDRDGDLFLVECPTCHKHQNLHFHRAGRDKAEAHSECGQAFSHFFCYSCRNCISVWLEDGVREIKDHREGNVPLPTYIVSDTAKEYHMGIAKDAPWWWPRKQVWRDFNPDNGKDAHGHKHYSVFHHSPIVELPSEADCCKEAAAPPQVSK